MRSENNAKHHKNVKFVFCKTKKNQIYFSAYFCCSLPFFKNINEVVANTTSIKIANCFSSTIATTRIAAAHMIELEINNFLLILCRQFYLLYSNGVGPTCGSFGLDHVTHYLKFSVKINTNHLHRHFIKHKPYLEKEVSRFVLDSVEN